MSPLEILISEYLTANNHLRSDWYGNPDAEKVVEAARREDCEGVVTLTKTERAALINAHHTARHQEHRWYQCFESLLSARNSILHAAGDKAFVQHDGEQLELLKDAATDLGRFVGIARKNRDAANAEMARIDEQLGEPKAVALTDVEFAELGMAMAANPTAISTNIEGSAFIAECDRQKREAIAIDGCCGGTPMADGYCYGIGKCPRHFEAEACVGFVNRYIGWLDHIEDETALAAVAARLSTGSVTQGEMIDV